MRLLPDISPWSLRKKLVSVIMLGSAVCLLVGLAVLVASSARGRYADSIQQLSGLADVLAENGQAAMAFGDQQEAGRLLESLREHHEIAAAWLVGADGAVLASWNRKGAEQALPAGYRVRGRLLNSSFWSRHAELYGPVERDGEVIGYVLLRADFTEQWNRQVADLGKALGAAMLALLVVYLLAMRLQRVISRPIGEMAETARAIAQHKTYGLRVPQSTDDEIGRLVRAFNEMLGEIQQRDEHLISHRDRLEEEVAKRTAELRKSKEDAEEASRFKGIFLANMSHEIRTPMNAIIGLSDLALAGELTPKLRDYLSKIHSSSMALLAITNDILDYSKVDAGRMELEHEEFSLDGLLENVYNLFVVRAEEKGLDLVLELDHRAPRMLMGDALRLGQVMNNLVGNAVKFTAAGEVHIKVAVVRAEAGQATLQFSVRDTGIGMTQEQLAHLFQPFSQADGSITRRFGGTGLGLALSKRLVEMMGGEIEVQSEPEAGSTFSFTIRLELPAAAPAVAMLPTLPAMRVLIVDDLGISRQILRSIMEAWNFEVAEASSGAEALDQLKQANDTGRGFELVLLDWKMPGMDGLQLTRRIREMAHGKELQHMPVVIMVTAFSKEQLLTEAQDVALDAVLVKPVTPSVLLDSITRLQGAEVSEAVTESRPKLEQMAASIRGAHVLLVEDNEINQMVAREFLEHAGLHVTVAGNGLDGVEAVRHGHFDAVLMDLQMPVMSGFEATRMIRRNPQFRDLPVIAMTAAVLEKDRVACYEAGMNDHVAKPILPQQLIATLARWIRPGERTLPEQGKEAADAAASSLPAKLPGFDLEQVLFLLNGNRARLEQLLRRFGEEFGDATYKLRELIRAGNLKDAKILAHNVKGTAGILGAVDLYNAARELEQGLATDSPEQGLEGFGNALTQALESIALLAARAEGEDGEALELACGKCSWQQVAPYLGQLQGLLDGSDFVPHELLQKIRDLLPCQSMHRYMQQIEKHLDSFDYAQARAALADLHCIVGHDIRGNAA